MKILPKISNVTVSKIDDKNIDLVLNESININYIPSNDIDLDIVTDLLEHKTYGTLFLFLNENCMLNITNESIINESNINDFYNDCEEILKENIIETEEQGPLLTNINEFPIYENTSGVLLGDGKIKLKESNQTTEEFIEEESIEEPVEETNQTIDEEPVEESNQTTEEPIEDSLNEEGTQCSDIAPKIDYSDKIVKAPITRNK